MKIINKCDKSAFLRDLDNLTRSKYCQDRTISVDYRLHSIGFTIPKETELVFVPTARCISLLRVEPCNHIILTVGTSYRLPSIGDLEWKFYTVDRFPYPALKGIEGVLLAEVHCGVNNYIDGHQEIDKYYRISLYKVGGVEKTKMRLARFENGKEIEENNLKPGEDLDEVLHFSNFEGPGSYKDALEAEGVGFGITCCWGISMVMNKYNLSFPEAMRKSYGNGSLIEVNKGKSFLTFRKYY